MVSKLATFVSIVETQEQKASDLKITTAKAFNKRIRIEILTPEEAAAKGYYCGRKGGIFGNLELYQRHANPEDARYYLYSKWGEEMDREESVEVEKLYSNMGARKVCATKLWASEVIRATETNAAVSDVSVGIVGALSAELGYESKTAESLAENMEETWTWNAPRQRPMAMPGGYFVEDAKVLGKSVSTTPWELAKRFEKVGCATMNAAIIVSSVRMSAFQSKSYNASIKSRVKNVTGSLGGRNSKAREEKRDVISVYVITFWQEHEYTLMPDPEDERWDFQESVPDGAVTVNSVLNVLREVTESRVESQGLMGKIASVAKRGSQRLSRRVSETLGAMTLSSSVRIGVVGPVGAGKTSFATTLEIAANRIIPCLNEPVKDIFDSYTIRREGVQRDLKDGTISTKKDPYEERTVLSDDEGRQLLIYDTQGIRDLGTEAERFADYLADDKRDDLQKKADEWTGRLTPTPDMVFIVFDAQELGEGEEGKIVKSLKDYHAFMSTVRQKLNKPHLPFLIVVTKIDLVKKKDLANAKKTIERRITMAFASNVSEDVPDLHFVKNYTRSELGDKFQLIQSLRDQNLKTRDKKLFRKEYNEWIESCKERNSDHLHVARCALKAVKLSDDK